MNEHYPFVNYPLPYAYDAMEPFIDKKTMMLHHDRHLQSYVNHLNEALKHEKSLQRYSLEELILNAPCYPKNLQTEILHNAGGVYNHRFFFANLSNGGNVNASGILAAKIDETFGGYTQFAEEMEKAALSVFGSGYVWLVADPRGNLFIYMTPNQNTPITRNFSPILCVDVWEHAYYLKYYNVRKEYVQAWFHLINWKRANRNYISSMH